MQLGMIGLGRMGGNMVRRLMLGGHACVVYDRAAPAVDALVKDGASGGSSLADFAAKLSPPRTICLMVPQSSKRRSTSWSRCSHGETRSSTAGIPITRMTSLARSA
jgi:6-phosphogluconate dehydrogenase (decarboxylating)